MPTTLPPVSSLLPLPLPPGGWPGSPIISIKRKRISVYWKILRFLESISSKEEEMTSKEQLLSEYTCF